MSPKKVQIILGIMFITLGLAFLFLDINLFTGYMSLLILGPIFIFLYFLFGGPRNSETISLLLCGLTLLSLWIYYLFQSIGFIQHKGFLVILLSIPFLIVFLLHQGPIKKRLFWSLNVFLMLAVIGICWIFSSIMWPFLLLGIGSLLLITIK